MLNHKNLDELKSCTTPVLFSFIAKKFFEALPNVGEKFGGEISLSNYHEKDVFTLDQWAQRILLLANECSRAVINNIVKKNGAESRESYSLVKNDFDRFLWVWKMQPEMFELAYDSITKKLAGDSRSRLPCTMYRLPDGFSLKNVAESCGVIKKVLGELFWFSNGEISYDHNIYTEGNSFSDSPIHELIVYFNRPVEREPVIKNRKIVYENRTTADALYIVFHPQIGIVEIYAPDVLDRDYVARTFSILHLNIQEPMTKLAYAFKHLSGSPALTTTDKNITQAKLTSFNFSDSISSSRYEINSKSSREIQDGLVFKNQSESNGVLTQASITIDCERAGQPSQSVSIQFLGDYDARIIASNSPARWNIYGLLSEWDLLEDCEANELY